jgi:hypothetical protein
MMWTADEFLSLLKADALTFGVALGEHWSEVAALLADDESVRGFIVYLGFDATSHERIEWTLHALTESTLVIFNVRPRNGVTGSHRYAPNAFAQVSSRSLGAQRDPFDSDELHHLRDTEMRVTLLQDGSHTFYDGSEWFAMWQGSVTDLAVRGASQFFANLPHLV